MHSNGGSDFLSEARPSTVGESRRGRAPTALSRRRLGATSLIAGGSDESLRFVLPIGFLRTMTNLCMSIVPTGRSGRCAEDRLDFVHGDRKSFY
jgi:hypothetical protein